MWINIKNILSHFLKSKLQKDMYSMIHVVILIMLTHRAYIG